MPTKVHLPDGRIVHFPDSMTPADIERAIGDLDETRKPVASHERTPDRTLTDTALDVLPTVGGAVGGLLGAPGGLPGAMGGAALGGAGGEAAKQLVNRLRGRMVPQSAGEAATDIGIAGGTQAGAEAGGRMISGTLRKLGGRIYQGLLKPTLAQRLEHPDLVETALKNGIPISAGGADDAGALVGESKAAADALVAARAAGPNAPTIDPRHAVAGITRAVRDVKDLPVARPQMKAIGDYGRAYLSEHQQPMALTDAQRAVRATDKFFDSTYRATMDRGNAVTSGNTAAALGINNETRNLLRQAVPGLKEQNAKTQALAGVKEAVERRTGQQSNLSPIPMRHLISAGLGGSVGAIGGTDKGMETFAASELLSNPSTGSRIAIGMNRASGAPWNQAVRAALLALLASREQEPD